jgi:hypothetical protein
MAPYTNVHSLFIQSILDEDMDYLQYSGIIYDAINTMYTFLGAFMYAFLYTYK